jgi:hypothetical protein
MVEQALHGYDVQLSAVHFAATSLAMLNPEIEFDRMNLYVMPYGTEGGQAALGSLEFLGQEEVPVQFALSPEMAGNTESAARVSGSGRQGAVEGQTARLPELDLAIMNPPFTRSTFGNLLFGSLPDSERGRVQSELKGRLKGRRANATAGLGPAFVAAASPKLRPGEGRLALVLPSTVCTGPSWKQTRSLIEEDFHLDFVVVSHDSEKWNFSDSTSLSEVLLIASKRNPDRNIDTSETVFVNLWQNPKSLLEAHRVAQAVCTSIPAPFNSTGSSLLEVDGRFVGEVFAIEEERLLGKQWVGVQFSRADLSRSAVRFFDDFEIWVPGELGQVAVPTCKLSQLGGIGPDIRDVRDGFAPTDTITAYPMVENHDSNQRRFISTDPDRYLSPLVVPAAKRKLKPFDQLWPKAGRLLVGARFRLNTARVLAMRSSVNVLASMWWPVKMENELHEKALALWLNGSLGILSLMAIRNTTEGGWVQPKKADLTQMKVVDLRHLESRKLEAMAQLFDDLAEAEFERLPNMVDCPARRALDDGLSEILGLPNLEGLRRLLASEPVVSNRRL